MDQNSDDATTIDKEQAENNSETEVKEESTNAQNAENKNTTNENQAPLEQPVEQNATAKENFIKSDPTLDPNHLGVLSDVSMSLSIEIGRAQIKIRDLLNLTKGSIVELNKAAGEPVDIYANGKLISTGTIITANGKYCVRVTSILEKSKIGTSQDGK